jgi:2-iminobutanoate/2-iminopropanoate deaminase
MKRIINTPNAPEAVGAYPQGIISRGFLFASGQVALIPGPERRLANGSIQEETHQVLQNLMAVLGAGGCQLADVVQARIFVRREELFVPVNEVYKGYFVEGEEPARECVVAAPPLEGAHVEMSMIAEVPTEHGYGRLI